MNIYKLEKKATPCPIAPSCCEARNGYDTELFTEVTHTSVCDFSVFQARRKHDAKLLAHCRNNFLKALEALKTAEQELLHSDSNLACHNHCDYDAGCRCSVCPRRKDTVLSKLIAELEEVKTWTSTNWRK